MKTAGHWTNTLGDSPELACRLRAFIMFDQKKMSGTPLDNYLRDRGRKANKEVIPRYLTRKNERDFFRQTHPYWREAAKSQFASLGKHRGITS